MSQPLSNYEAHTIDYNNAVNGASSTTQRDRCSMCASAYEEVSRQRRRMTREMRIQNERICTQDQEIARLDRIEDELGGRIETLEEELDSVCSQLRQSSRVSAAAAAAASSTSDQLPQESRENAEFENLTAQQWFSRDWLGEDGTACRRILREIGVFSYADLQLRYQNAMSIDLTERVSADVTVIDFYQRLHPMAARWFEYRSPVPQTPTLDTNTITLGTTNSDAPQNSQTQTLFADEYAQYGSMMHRYMSRPNLYLLPRNKRQLRAAIVLYIDICGWCDDYLAPCLDLWDEAKDDSAGELVAWTKELQELWDLMCFYYRLEAGHRSIIDYVEEEENGNRFEKVRSGGTQLIWENQAEQEEVKWETAVIDFAESEWEAANALLLLSGFDPPTAHQHRVNTKYKPVAKKVLPVNTQHPAGLNAPMRYPGYSRDPYQTPLTPFPPKFEPGGRLTAERIALIEFGPKGWLTEEEKSLVLHVLRLREKAMTFDEMERGCLKDSYADPYVIPVVPHDPWTEKNIPIPLKIREQVLALIRQRLRSGLYERAESPYSSRWFCVPKKDNKLRLVHGVEKMNSITIAEQMRVIRHVLADEIPDVADAFLDDVACKGPEEGSDHDIIPGSNIRKWVFDHCVRIERILFRFEEAGLTAAGKKAVAISPELEIVGQIVSADGRKMSSDKVNKILRWPALKNPQQVRSFLGL